MNTLLLDLSVALRFFARRRAATAVIVLTMALALGANTAVFSVLKAFVFSSLAVPESDRVVFVWTVREIPGRGGVDFNDAYPNFQRLRESTHFWEHLATSVGTDVNWEQDADTRRLQGSRVTADFFALMRVQPSAGRLFTAPEEGPGAAPVALISHALWRSAFGGEPGVVGRTLRFNGAPHTIIGVLPPGFGQPQGTDVWLPFDLPQNQWTLINGGRQLATYARLAPGATVATANAELKAFAPRAIEADPANKEWSWRVQPIRENLLAGADRALIFVQVGAGVLLLLAITNLASLLIAWAAERQRETAVRLALGATSWRLIRQFLVQSLVVVAAGGALGVLLAAGTLPALQRLNPNPQFAALLSRIELDAGTLGFAAGLVLGTGLVAGLLPAWQARQTAVSEALRSESRGASLSRGAIRWQQAMVVIQAAISVVILSCAAVALAGFKQLDRVELGFATGQRAAFRFQFPEPAYASHEQRARLVRTLEQNLAREPALASHAVTGTLPVGDLQWGGGFHPQASTGEFAKDPSVFHYRRITPGFFATLGIPLLEGRLLNDRDRAETPTVVVVSKTLADKYWPGRSAIGRKLRRVSPADAPPVEIVGVVDDVRDAGVGVPAGETVYVAWDQVSLRRAWVVMHGRGSIKETIAAGRRALRATAPEIAAYGADSLDHLAWQVNALPRLLVVLLGGFAVIAAGITALGTYGVMSQLVANREKEMAIRAALGATGGGVLRLVLWSNARLAVLGVLLGLGAAWAAGRWVTSLVPGFDAGANWAYAAVALGVLMLTQLASYLPAARAARLDVQKALGGA